MVTIEPKTIRMITTTEEEIFEKLVKQDNVFRKLDSLIDFEGLVPPYRNLYSDTGAQGIDVIKGFKALLVQFWEDYSDREMEKAIEENMAIKWFCGCQQLDSWRSKMRMPFESTFSKQKKRTKFRGQAKVLFQCFTEAICYNLKKAITILPTQLGA